MGSKVNVPPPTPEERELQRNQAELLALQRQIIEQQRAQNAVLLPFLAEQEGYDVEVDGQGNITKIVKRFDPDDAKRKELESGFLDRSLKALKGELPVDPALEESLQKQEEDLRNRLSAQLGPGYETSTPGIETLAEFMRSSEILREGARTGQLTLAEQLGITRDQQEMFRRQSSQDVLRQSSIGDPLTFAGAFGQTARGFGQAQVPFIQHRQMQLNASIANAQSANGLMGAGIGALGGILGMLSDERLKRNIEAIRDPNGKVTELLPGVPYVTYEFIWDKPGKKHLGVLAQDLQKALPEAVYENDEGYLLINEQELQRLIQLKTFDEAAERYAN
jgi:hypothetical protein